jgi:hypothetical protein
MSGTQPVDVGAFVAAMERFGVPEDIMTAVAEAIEASPSTTLEEAVEMLRGKGLAVVKAHRVKNALLAARPPAITEVQLIVFIVWD